MKHKIFIYLGFFLAVIFFACSKDNNPASQKEVLVEEVNCGFGEVEDQNNL